MKTWQSQKDGITVQYREAGTGPVLVLIHAFPQDSEMWQPQLEALGKVARVICPDVVGFGGTTPQPKWSVDSYADLMDEFLPGIGITEPVVFGGLSMGGYIAMAFARRHPSKLRGLILADTRAEADSEEAQAGRDKSMAFVREHGSATFFEKMMLPKVISQQSREANPALEAQLLQIASRQSAESVIAALNALKTRPNALPGLATIHAPTLIVCGHEDAITPPAMSLVMAQTIPQARLEHIAGAGHLSNIESPAAFNASVERWLKTV